MSFVMSFVMPFPIAPFWSFQLLQASLSCLVAGACVWAALQLLQRFWPVRLSVLPAIPLEQGALMPAFDPSADAVAQAAPSPAVPWPLLLAQGWLLLYPAGLALALLRLARAQRRCRRLLAAARTLTAAQLAVHPAFTPAQLAQLRQHRLSVRETDAAVSPMLLGLLRPCLLLPSHLHTFSAAQQQMIVEHELTHHRRRDPLWLAANLLLQTALWFNPVLRKLGEKLNWAQELSCDQQVLSGRPQHQRQHYAAALVQQLRIERASFDPALGMAFGGLARDTIAARLTLMRATSVAHLGAAAKCLLGAASLGLLAASVLLQPAFAHLPAAPAAPAPTPAPAWRAPLDSARVSSPYGVVDGLRPKGHRGIDFAAPRGTPILATADGVVVAATEHFDENPAYGTVVMLEHAGGLRSLYAHLDSRAVQPGAQVKAGQRLGTVGRTGKATGPHLHLELRRGAEFVDPQSMLPGLQARAAR